MIEENSPIDYELITKYLAGEASTEDEAKVTLWLKTSEENRHAFAEMKTIWQQAGRIMPHEKVPVDVDKGWGKFKSKIESGDKTIGHANIDTKTRSLFYYFSRAAAVLVIGLGFYWIYQNLESNAIESRYMEASHQVVSDTLSDGSLISLNVQSQLSFPEKFGPKQRSVTLKGEAFFIVEPDAQKPFVVEVDGATITVLGTSFYVQAYDSLEAITVGVKEGTVKVANRDTETVLEAGESVTINSVSNKMQAIEAFDPNELYWKSKTLIFQNERLETVFQTLERHYAVKITADNQKLLDCRLTAKFYDENIDQVLEIIKTNFNLVSTKEDKRFTISGNGCE